MSISSSSNNEDAEVVESDGLRLNTRDPSDYTPVISLHSTGKWVGHYREFPGVRHYGASKADCLAKLQTAIGLVLQDYAERNAKPPLPGEQPVLRGVQMNIRLTTTERELLDRAVRSAGYESVSEYVREAALADAHRRLYPSN